MSKFTKVFIPKSRLSRREGKGFETKLSGKIFRGIVVKQDGQYFAYQNLCKHLPITLDLNDDEFFSHDKAFIQCQMHGAIYEIQTGKCIAGPCEGAKLNALKVIEEEDQLIVLVPNKAVA